MNAPNKKLYDNEEFTIGIFLIHTSLCTIIGFHKANKNRIKIDTNMAITPKSLFGIDRKIA
jgi:hypothetical protein